MKSRIKSVGFALLMLLSTAAFAQKGAGEKTGISKQGLNPEIIELKGMVTTLEQGPCKYTTGRSISGTHLLLKTADKKTLNIHLGPTSEVSKFVKGAKGKTIFINAFRTEKLPADHYIAKTLVIDDKMTVLRNENLKPIWAGRTGAGRERWRTE